MVLGYAIEIGRKLKEAKTLLPYGQWGRWLQEEVEFSQSTAQNFMKIFEEYGARQVSLLGTQNPKRLGICRIPTPCGCWRCRRMSGRSSPGSTM